MSDRHANGLIPPARVAKRLAWRALYGILRPVGLEGLVIREVGLARQLEPLAAGTAPAGTGGPIVCMIAPRHWTTHVALQTALAQALAVRGARCVTVTCGGIQPICEIDWRAREPVNYCHRCVLSVSGVSRSAGVPVRALGNSDGVGSAPVLPATVPELEAVEWESLAIGRYAATAARWKLRTVFLEQHELGVAVLRDFVHSGMRWADHMSATLDELRPNILVLLNGMFLPERLTAELARRRGIRCVFFERGRDAETFFFSHDLAAPRYDISTAWTAQRETALGESERNAILSAFARRARGEGVVERYWSDVNADGGNLRASLGIPEQAPVAVLYTNVAWDTAMQDRDTAFRDMFDWLRQTVEYFGQRAEAHLVIRAHPAETQLEDRRSHDRVADWLRDGFGPLPRNIHVIAADEPIDSYALMRLANVGLVYASTTGLELAIAGVPVIVAGDAHYARKGFTTDPSAPDEYRLALTAALDGELDEVRRDADRELALRYAHLFFLRRSFRTGIVREPRYGRPEFDYRRLSELEPGRHRELDVICDGILHGREFLL